MARRVTQVRNRQAGVTLIEMLVVLSIIGVAAGAVMLRFPARSGGSAQAEADRLAGALSVAADRALLSGQAETLIWDAGGYEFGPVADGTPGAARHPLAAPLVLARADGSPEPLAIAASGLALPATLVLRDAGGGAWQVAFDGLNAAALPQVAP